MGRNRATGCYFESKIPFGREFIFASCRESLTLQSRREHGAEEATKMLKRLQQAVINNENVFAVLTDAVRACSLGHITNALFEV